LILVALFGPTTPIDREEMSANVEVRHSLRATLDGILAAASDPPQAEEPSEGSKIALVPAAAARLATAPNPVPDHDLGEASKVEPSPPRSVNKSKRHPKSPQLNR
jgi:hypothetical protein